jgi:hypothetical protein
MGLLKVRTEEVPGSVCHQRANRYRWRNGISVCRRLRNFGDRIRLEVNSQLEADLRFRI